MKDDLISRQAVIDLVEELETQRLKGDIGLLSAPMIKGLKKLPSVQETHDKRTETHACDLISRQAAISFVDCGYLRPPTELAWSDKDVVDMLKRVPSVQPTQNNTSNTSNALKSLDCVDRQAAIEAAAIPPEWDGMYIQDLNGRIREAIEQLPSAQPEIIRCKDCKHYDGRPCGIVDWYNTADDFCSRAERGQDADR